ncbi:MAG: hypothetical protein NTV87_03415, partial [Ignavibacteriae bacterium]|nr:hypothetical protein [Ignavibacteriota bacterium]
MKKTILVFVLSLISFAVVNANPKIHEYLKGKMDSAKDNEKIPVYIIFTSHLSLSDFDFIGYDTPKKERREIVVNRLIKFSEQSQSNVTQYLNAKKSANIIDGYEIIWIINRIALKADRNIINDIASDFSEVLMICYDPQYPVEEMIDLNIPKPPFLGAAASPTAIEPG